MKSRSRATNVESGIDNRIDSGEACRYSLVKNRINKITIYRIDKHTSRKEDGEGGSNP